MSTTSTVQTRFSKNLTEKRSAFIVQLLHKQNQDIDQIIYSLKKEKIDLKEILCVAVEDIKRIKTEKEYLEKLVKKLSFDVKQLKERLKIS